MYKDKKQELQDIKKVKEYESFVQSKQPNGKKSYEEFSEQFQDQSQVRNRNKKKFKSYDQRSLYQDSKNGHSPVSNKRNFFQQSRQDLNVPQQQILCHLCTDCVINKLDDKQSQRQKKKFSNHTKSNLIDLSEIANKEEDNSQIFLQYYKKRQNTFQDILNKSKSLDKPSNDNKNIEVQKPVQFNNYQNKSDAKTDAILPNTKQVISQTDNQSKSQIQNSGLFFNEKPKKNLNETSLPNKSSLFKQDNNATNLFQNQKTSNLPEQKKDDNSKSLVPLTNNQPKEKEGENQSEIKNQPQTSIFFDNKNASSLLSNQNTLQEIKDSKEPDNNLADNKQEKQEQKEGQKKEIQNLLVIKNLDEQTQIPLPPLKPAENSFAKNNDSGIFNNNNSGIFNNNNSSTGMFNQNNKSSSIFDKNNQSTSLFNNKNTGIFQNNNDNKINTTQQNQSNNITNNQNNNQKDNSNSLFNNKSSLFNNNQNKQQTPTLQPNNPPSLFNNNPQKNDNNNQQPNTQSQIAPGPFFSPNQNKPQNNSLQNANALAQNSSNKSNPFMASMNINKDKGSMFSQQAQNYKGLNMFENNGASQNKPSNMFSKNQQNFSSLNQQNSSKLPNTNMFSQGKSNSLFRNK